MVVLLCVAWRTAQSHGAVETGANIRNISDNKGTDALESLLSGLGLEKMQALLKDMPPELQLLAGQVLNNNKMDMVAGQIGQLQSALLQAAKDKGLLNVWKDKLNSMLTSDDKVARQKNVKCADHENCNEKKLSLEEETKQNDVDYLMETAKEVFQDSNKIPDAPKVVKKMPIPPASAYDRSKMRGETNKVLPKKKNQMDGLIGLAKQFMGQDENDPSLDIMANMASAYLKSSDGSGSNNAGGSGPDLNSILQLVSMFSGAAGGEGKSGSPLDSLSSLLGNSGMDMNQLLQLGSAFMNQGNNKEISSSGRINKPKASSPIAELVIRFLATTFNLDPNYMINYYNGLTSLIEANSWDEINSILRRNVGTDAEALLDALANNELRQQMSDTTTSLFVDWLYDFISNPENLKTKLFYLNGLLEQYKFPTIDPKNLIESISRLVDRLSKKFTGTQIEVKPYLQSADRHLRKVLHVEDHDDLLDFSDISKEELMHAVEHSMKTEVFDPLADLWADFRLASRYPKCARTIVCMRNSPSTTRSAFGVKSAITRATR